MANWSNHLNTMQTDAEERRKYNMAAKDYKICCALFNAYIAKESKRDKNCMTDDRRQIPEGEILMLIDWWLDKNCGENGNGMRFDSLIRDGKKVVLRFVDADDNPQ